LVDASGAFPPLLLLDGGEGEVVFLCFCTILIAIGLRCLTIGFDWHRGIGSLWPSQFSVNVNVNLYSTLSHSASNALDAPNTAETNASSIGDRSWQC